MKINEKIKAKNEEISKQKKKKFRDRKSKKKRGSSGASLKRISDFEYGMFLFIIY